ncbi:hypothetical protein OROHE_017499 [Orobanche hederae]
MENAFVEAGPPVFLDQLALTVTGPIIAMVCRKWDINAITGRYLSTDFLISDGKGNTMHCTAKAKTAHTFVTKLKEGNIYTINQFAVIPNTEEYRIMKKSAYIIEFHGGTTVRKSLVKSDGFVRHPFDLIAFDDLQVTDNKHLIDVVGFITNVGRSIKQKSGSRTLDFYLTNRRSANQLGSPCGESWRCTDRQEDKEYWPSCCNFDRCKSKAIQHSSSTIILDDGEIPALKAFKSETMEIHEIYYSVTFNCHVTIDDIRTRKGWNYPSCGSDKCRKGTTRREGKFWCDSCNKPTDYPVVRYRLELDVSDDTARTVVVLFDELSYQLVKYSAQSLLKEEDEHFNIVIDDSDTETVPAVSEVPEDGDDSEPAAKKKLKGIVIEESDTETVLDGSAELEDNEDSKPAPNKKPRRYIEECYQSE